MPGRKTPLVTQEIYHVFNRGIERRPTFTTQKEYLRALNSIKFYQSEKPPVKLSRFLNLNEESRQNILIELQLKDKLVEILAYCLMPNHFHFLLKQKKDNGISKFIGNFQNSYTRFYNTKNSRDGSLFLDQFKAVRIESDEQLIHVSRYIHLNPFTSYLIKDIELLEEYQWSSFSSYITGNLEFISSRMVLEYFNYSVNSYKEFIYDQSDYQRKLSHILHLILE